MTRLICGPNAVEIAIRETGNQIQAIYLQTGLNAETVTRIFSAARKNGLTAASVPAQQIDAMAPDMNHQGVVAIAGAYPYTSLDALLNKGRNHPDPLLVILDQVQDPGNLGAVIRSAKCFGATGVIITKDRSAHMTSGAIRSSAGASELIPVCQVVNLSRALSVIKAAHYTIAGAAANRDTPLYQVDFKHPTAIVFGNEAKGLRQLTARNCDFLFSIPMPGGFDSLNVSAAAAVTLYEAARQKTAPS